MKSELDIFEHPEILYEMSNLSQEETGLDFMVWASPKGGAKHSARIKVTHPPFGKNPIAVYSISPFEFVAGEEWLSAKQVNTLSDWVEINYQTLIDFWNDKITMDLEFHSKIKGVNDVPPFDKREAVISLRAIAPKVKMIQWKDGEYHLIFDYLPSLQKIIDRFVYLGFKQRLNLHKTPIENAVILWTI